MTTVATHARQPQRHTLTLGGVPLVAYTRPDMSALADALPALSLMAEHASVSTDQRVLVGPSGSGALGFADRTGPFEGFARSVLRTASSTRCPS